MTTKTAWIKQYEAQRQAKRHRFLKAELSHVEARRKNLDVMITYLQNRLDPHEQRWVTEDVR